MVDVLLEALEISGFVFLMMLAIDFLDVRSNGWLQRTLGRGGWRQYGAASALGAAPGCLGTFTNVTLYMHGLLGFGALTAGMIATTGDSAFVMLTRFPREACLLIGFQLVTALSLGWLIDRSSRRLRLAPVPDCDLQEVHDDEQHRGHYLREHIWNHIIKKHLWRVFLWTLGALLVIHFGFQQFNIEGLVAENLPLVLVIAVLIGLIPDSGPHLVIVFLFADGVLPFSILLASAIAQDGHGILPLLSFSLRDAVIVKAYCLSAGLLVGGAAFLAGF